MSYSVTIEPVTKSELIKLASLDKSISLKISDDYIQININRNNTNLELNFSENQISNLTTPKNAELKTMQDLAVKLKAKVFGEGEDLTNVKVDDTELEGCGATFYTVFAVMLMIIAYWVFAD